MKHVLDSVQRVAAKAAGSDESRPSLQMVHVTEKGEAVATDGHMMIVIGPKKPLADAAEPYNLAAKYVGAGIVDPDAPRLLETPDEAVGAFPEWWRAVPSESRGEVVLCVDVALMARLFMSVSLAMEREYGKHGRCAWPSVKVRVPTNPLAAIVLENCGHGGEDNPRRIVALAMPRRDERAT